MSIADPDAVYDGVFDGILQHTRVGKPWFPMDKEPITDTSQCTGIVTKQYDVILLLRISSDLQRRTAMLHA